MLSSGSTLTPPKPMEEPKNLRILCSLPWLPNIPGESPLGFETGLDNSHGATDLDLGITEETDIRESARDLMFTPLIPRSSGWDPSGDH
ncbi:hypothetical protein N7467_003244 [Penicillium canescens]|nr:hypothetical protein N7467_003244 [Penicillium canescens]